MKKNLLMAFVAILSFTMISCGSDGDSGSDGDKTTVYTLMM